MFQSNKQKGTYCMNLRTLLFEHHPIVSLNHLKVLLPYLFRMFFEHFTPMYLACSHLRFWGAKTTFINFAGCGRLDPTSQRLWSYGIFNGEPSMIQCAYQEDTTTQWAVLG